MIHVFVFSGYYWLKQNHNYWGEPERVVPSKLVLSTMNKKLRQKPDNLHVRREFNGVDYNASLCNRPCHDK